MKRITWMFSVSLILLFISAAFIPCVGGDDDDEGPPEHVTLDKIMLIGFMEYDGNVTFGSIALDIVRDQNEDFIILAKEHENSTMELIKVNDRGKTQWNRRYLLQYNETVYNLTFNNNETNNTTLYVNLTWYNQAERWTPYKFVSASDGGFLVLCKHIYETYNQPMFHDNGSMHFGNGTMLNDSDEMNVLVKIDHNGTIVWEASLEYYDELIDVVEMDNKEIVILATPTVWGIIPPRVNDTPPLVIVTFDEGGNYTLDKTLDDSNEFSAVKMIKTMNDKLVILGTEDNNHKIALLKIDSTGEKLWRKSYLEDVDFWTLAPQEIIETDEGDFLISGAEDATDGNSEKWFPWIIRLDTNGNQMWTESYGTFKMLDVEINSMVWTVPEELLCFGTTDSFDRYNNDLIVFKANANGSITWDVQFTGTGSSELAIKIFDEGNGTYFLFSGGDRMLLLKTNQDPTLDIDHDTFLDSYEYETFGNLDQTPDSDADGDGFSNQEEIDKGTDPADEFDYPGQEETIYIALVILAVVFVLILIVVIVFLLRVKPEKEEEEKPEEKPPEKKKEEVVKEESKPEDNKGV